MNLVMYFWKTNLSIFLWDEFHVVIRLLSSFLELALVQVINNLLGHKTFGLLNFNDLSEVLVFLQLVDLEVSQALFLVVANHKYVRGSMIFQKTYESDLFIKVYKLLEQLVDSLLIIIANHDEISL